MKQQRMGFEFLESDTELYNILCHRQEMGDEILELFNIQLINDDYTQRDAEEVNTIYILRDEMTANQTSSTFTTDGYTVRIQLIISCSQYDTIKANALLKTTTRAINQILKLESLSAYCTINRIIPRYTEPGRLSEYRLELLAYELDETREYQSHKYKLNLLIHADIMNKSKVAINKVYPVMPPSKPLPYNIKEEKIIDEDNFTGG